MSVTVFNPNALTYPLGTDPLEELEQTALQPEALYGFYKATPAATKAAATALATGPQKRLFTVAADESASGAIKRYLYEGVTGVLGTAF